MLKKFSDLTFTKIVAISATVVLLGHFVSGGVTMVKEKSVVPEVLTIGDFETESMVERKKDGLTRYVATDSDPQLLLTVDGTLTGVKFYMETTMPASEIVVYYTQSAEEGFSERSRVWADTVSGEDGWYRVTLPGGYVHTLRIDPSIYGGNFMTFGDFILNPEKSSADYFGISYRNLPFLVLYTGILASVARFIQEIFTKKSD